MKLSAIVNDYNSRGRGKTTLRFRFDRAARKWIRLDHIVGAEIIEQASYVSASNAHMSRSSDRHSKTVVDLPVALDDDLFCWINRGGVKVTSVHTLTVDDAGEILRDEIDFGCVRNAAGGWNIKIRSTGEIIPGPRS